VPLRHGGFFSPLIKSAQAHAPRKAQMLRINLLATVVSRQVARPPREGVSSSRPGRSCAVPRQAVIRAVAPRRGRRNGTRARWRRPSHAARSSNQTANSEPLPHSIAGRPVASSSSVRTVQARLEVLAAGSRSFTNCPRYSRRCASRVDFGPPSASHARYNAAYRSRMWRRDH